MSNEAQEGSSKSKTFKAAAAIAGLSAAVGAGAGVAGERAMQQHDAEAITNQLDQERGDNYAEQLYQPGLNIQVFNGEVSLPFLLSDEQQNPIRTNPDHDSETPDPAIFGIENDDQRLILERPVIVEGADGGLWYEFTQLVPSDNETTDRETFFVPVGNSTVSGTDGPAFADVQGGVGAEEDKGRVIPVDTIEPQEDPDAQYGRIPAASFIDGQESTIATARVVSN